MELDINKLLNLDYLNERITSFNADISQLKSLYVDLIDFDYIKTMPKEEIVKLFELYHVGCSNILQYIESDFIDEEWEFADLFLDDIKYSTELKDSIKNSALIEVEELNVKIKEHNNKIGEQLLEIEDKKKLIDVFVSILDANEVVSSKDIAKVYDVVMNLNCSDEEKFLFSNSLAMMLIAKNKELFLREQVVVDTSAFEKELEEAYSTAVDTQIEEEPLKEGAYSETIKGYYDFYKNLIDEIGLGNSLDEVMEVSASIGSGIDSSLHSINKEDFCIELGFALANLYKSHGKDKVDQDLMTDSLMDLSVLDRIYEENEKNKEQIRELLDKVVSDVQLISLIPIELLENSFVKKIMNFLKIIKLELSNNLIDDEGLSVLESKYREISSKIGKIQIIIKMLETLNNINNGLLSLIKSEYSLQNDGQIYDLQSRIVLLIEKIKSNGYKLEYEREVRELTEEFKKYNKKEVVQDNKFGLTGFILFDFDENFNPYVLSDMDPNNRNNLIDSSIPAKKMISGFEDYSKLVRDLLVYGKPELIVNNNQVYYMSRILENVYYDEARNHSTGIVRIRPVRSSLVRFMSKEVVLSPDTEIYKQVTGLIMETLPNVSINLNKEFSLFINFASSLKKTDTDSYVEAIHRFERRSPLYKLFLIPASKTRLTDEEYSLLKDILSMSLDAYTELEKRNNELKFDFISQIGGNKSRG